MITIVDYGMGNLGSIFNMFKKIGFASKISSDIEEIKAASKIVLPGVGAFDNAMKKINDSGFKEILTQKALVEKVPFLGICLGMQLLTDSSEEGSLPGLGFVPAKTIRFNSIGENNLKIPHMGWNPVTESNSSSLTENMLEETRFYFVHSYYVKVKDEKNSILKTTYGIDFDSAIQKDNIFGVQFHPEKSHKFGMNLLKNFAKM
jgi:imidazole glycerol-phosphate synthase subunit HisH